MINNNSKNFAEAAKDFKNNNKFNIFTDITHCEYYNYHYKSDFIGYLLDPLEKHNLKDYFIKQIIDIIKDKYQINDTSYMDLQVKVGYHSSKSKYFTALDEIIASSISNNILFVFYIETEDIDPQYSIVVQKNYENVLVRLKTMKDFFKPNQLIPVLITDNESLCKKYDIFYTIMINDIINIMENIPEVYKNKYYKDFIKKFTMQSTYNHSREDILFKNYLKIYSRYSQEVDNIYDYGPTYYIKKILLSFFQNKNFIEKDTIMDCNIDGSPSFTFLPSGLDDEFIDLYYKKSYIIGFDIHVYTDEIEVYFTLNTIDDKLKLLKQKLVLLFNDKYNLDYQDNQNDNMYITIFKFDINAYNLIYINHKALAQGIDIVLEDLYDKIVSFKIFCWKYMVNKKCSSFLNYILLILD